MNSRKHPVDEVFKPRYFASNDIRQLCLSPGSAAAEGKAVIDEYLAKEDAYGLAELLRHHDEEDIDDDETWTRDYVDYFIEYYSMLCVAYCSGYVSFEEIWDERGDICLYLGNAAVKRYYGYNYPLLLPQILLEMVVSNRRFAERDIQPSNHFLEFHALNQTIENDDVNQFLWFLDGGSNDDYDIDSLYEVLADGWELRKVLKRQSNSAIVQSARGFLDYIAFLQQFDVFLKSVKEPFERCVYWEFHAYWFGKFRSELKPVIKKFYRGMHSFVNEYIGDYSKQHQTINTAREKDLSLIDRLVFDPLYAGRLERKFERWMR